VTAEEYLQGRAGKGRGGGGYIETFSGKGRERGVAEVEQGGQEEGRGGGVRVLIFSDVQRAQGCPD